MTVPDVVSQREDQTGAITAGGRGSSAAGLLVVAGAVVGIASAQGGYFPTSWGLGTLLLLWATGLWLVVSGRTDAGRLDAAFLLLLALFTAWVGVSTAWSSVPGQSVLELERTLVLLSGLTAVLVLVRREQATRLAGVLLVSITVVSTYALATRLLPDRLGRYDSVSAYRLADPIGYWNALGVFAGMGVLLALGFVVEARARWARAAAAACAVLLATTIYFTYSRGAWLALAVGACLVLVLTPRRLRTVATALVLAVPASLAVLLASRSEALTEVGAPLSRASDEGRALALVVVALAATAAAGTFLLHAAMGRVALPHRLRLGLGAALLGVAAVTLVALLAREGGPVAAARHGWDAFSAPPPATGSDLDARLFTFSGTWRVDLWHGAVRLYAQHPLTGAGAGTFERFWQSRDDAPLKVRDAHSLYLETLAELGPVGLALLVAALLVPLAAGLTARRHPAVPMAVGAYVAFLVHAGVDWDWELSGVALTALIVGSIGLVAARSPGERRALTAHARGAAGALAVVGSIVAIAVFLGNGALDRAQNAVADRDFGEAVQEANRARTLMPWSPWPLIARGDAQLAAGYPAVAAKSYREAIEVDDGEWRAWFGLGLSTRGATRMAALVRAHELYPRNPDVTEAISESEVGTK